MRNLLVFATMVTLAVPVFLLVGCQPGEEAEVGVAPAEEAAAPAMSDEDMIGEIATDFVTAWNAGDASTIAAFWTSDGDSVGPEGEMAKGREEVEKRYAEYFEGLYKGTTFSVAITSIRFIQPDVAVVDGSYEIAGLKDAEGQDLPAIKGMYTNICLKEGDQWFIACSRPMIPIQAPGTT